MVKNVNLYNEKKSLKTKNWIYITIIMSILIIDIFSKNWIINNIALYDTQKIFLGLNFFHIHNYGLAFSLLSNITKSQRWLLSLINTLVILTIINITINFDKKETRKIIACCLVIAGAIGNLIDRIFYGFVIDFIDLHIYDWHFATFNIADCSIFFGVLVLIKKNIQT